MPDKEPIRFQDLSLSLKVAIWLGVLGAVHIIGGILFIIFISILALLGW